MGRQRKGFYQVSALYPTLLSHGEGYCRVAKSKMCMLSGLDVHPRELQKLAEVISGLFLATSGISEGQGWWLSIGVE